MTSPDSDATDSPPRPDPGPAHSTHEPGHTASPGQPPGRPVVRLRVRRSVNFPAFLLTGAVIGFLVGGLIELLGPTAVNPGTGAPIYTVTSAFSTLAMFCALLGTLVAAIVALLLDRRG